MRYLLLLAFLVSCGNQDVKKSNDSGGSKKQEVLEDKNQTVKTKADNISSDKDKVDVESPQDTKKEESDPDKTEVVLPVVVDTIEPTVSKPLLLDWNNEEWTKHLIIEIVQKGLQSKIPADIKDYCPNYKKLAEQDKVLFWANLMVAMAKKESNYSPQTTYTENFRDNSGKSVVSRGLFQLSIESANQKVYKCDFKTIEEMHDPLRNISCASNILSFWVNKDKALGSKFSGNWKGGARYWSVLRNGAPNNYVKKKTIEFCASK